MLYNMQHTRAEGAGEKFVFAAKRPANMCGAKSILLNTSK